MTRENPHAPMEEEKPRLTPLEKEMLAALRELADTSRAYLEHMDVDDLAALEAARAVIAKAEKKS